ncbi:hypothetical protein J5N97_027641 [Dioscorea zingiberensis]|uniref:CCHC-type domain-containing protein n=1 Tax=Dioscorea zingiberensis TaxID=325984 RepID=A0A9D5BXL7_9LILI|nr:hypothetical protein J5N97_027641 [Dioscorea zingiberensis]
METALQGGGSIHTPASVETGEGSFDDGGGWDVVHRKRKKSRSLNAGTKPAMGREGRTRTRRPPPTRRTSRGIEEVCGKCYQPGHWARECKNREVCRRCGGEGHRERDCRRRPTARVKDTGRPAPPPRKATALGKVMEKTKETHRRWPPEREELCEDNKGKALSCMGPRSQQLTEDKTVLGGGASRGWKRERVVLEMRRRLSPEPETHLRIRWGCITPCRIKCTIGTHTYIIPMAFREGERRLPWAEEGDVLPGLSTDDQRGEGVVQGRNATTPAKTPTEHMADHRFLTSNTWVTEQKRTAHGAQRAAVVPPVQGGKLEISKNKTLVGHVSRPNKIWVCRMAMERHVAKRGSLISSKARKHPDRRSQWVAKPMCMEASGSGHAPLPHEFIPQTMEKISSHPTAPKASNLASGCVAQCGAVDQMRSQQPDWQPSQQPRCVAHSEATDLFSSQHENSCDILSKKMNSCDIATWHSSKGHANDVLFSFEEANENPTQPITIYSKPENTKQIEDDDDKSDEEYLDPILVREFELEMEPMWKSQLEGEESNLCDDLNDKSIGEDQDGSIPTSPLIDPLTDPHGTNTMALLGPTIQSPLSGHEKDSKAPNQFESPTPEEIPNTSLLHTPTKIRGQEITITNEGDILKFKVLEEFEDEKLVECRHLESYGAVLYPLWAAPKRIMLFLWDIMKT